jgi:hypothetical protein
METIDDFITKWKHITNHIKKQSLANKDIKIIKRRFEKEKLDFIANSENISEVSYGIIFEELFKELDDACDLSFENFKKKQIREFIPHTFEKINDWFNNLFEKN